ncbi:MAG TPA: Spy/CpxP family protein refolding chaperone [Rubrivivax sp.]|nr:Spy/CpxP family protein refolding chaperone [Rubrivivax sp.]HPP82607.1 Spy/CpxP family protein refolding chaperone [Rubrivivax sp.]
MSTFENFPRRALRRTLTTAAVALACGVSLSALAQPAGGAAAAPGPQGGMWHHMGPGAGAGMGGGFGPMGMMGGRGMARALDAIGATAEQKAQIGQIMQAAQADLSSQREARTQLSEQARALFTAPTVDANAVEALRQKMLAQHDAASKRMMQAMLDASRVLTPEQRKALGERMATRRAMMQRHRAERATLDGTPRKP